MSVDTRADHCIDQAKQHLHDAIVELNEIVVLQCDGFDNFSEERYKAIKQAYLDLLAARDRLEGR